MSAAKQAARGAGGPIAALALLTVVLALLAPAEPPAAPAAVPVASVPYDTSVPPAPAMRDDEPHPEAPPPTF